MKTLTSILLITCSIAANNQVPVAQTLQRDAIMALLRNQKAAPTFNFKNRLELLVFSRQYATQLGLESKLVRGILKQESQFCKFKVNKRSKDYGCMQVNAATVRAYGFNMANIQHNEAYGVLAGLIILQDLKKHKQRTLKHKWPCAYNIGNKHLPKTCDAYMLKITRQ